MRRSIRKFNIPPGMGNPRGNTPDIWTFEDWLVQILSPRGKKAVQMPHQLLLKYLSSRTNFVFNQTLYTLFREICRNDIFWKTLLKELFTDKEEILSIKSVKPCKKTKNSRHITSEQEINPVQIPHSSNATFKFPPPRALCTVKCPDYTPGGGCWSFELIGALGALWIVFYPTTLLFHTQLIQDMGKILIHATYVQPYTQLISIYPPNATLSNPIPHLPKP